ncbi:MAG: TIGR03767 family metallophosphoesterase [Streptosporangiaceae bacterium]
MGVTRRAFLGGVLGAAGTATVAGFNPFPARRALALPAPSVAGTTLEQVILRGTAGTGGYAPLVSGPGEPYLRRTDLGGLPAGGGNSRVLACFGQLTDIHVTDVQSPARFEYFDSYGSIPGLSDLISAYRPNELLSAQVGDAMVARLRQVHRGPATGRPLQFTIVTGDNTDNCQFNELRWYIDLLDGQPVRPDSGDLTRYEGVMDDVAPDPYFWHPESGFGTPSSAFGFPTVPGLFDAARASFQAIGLGMPWYAAYGNHDGLVQGSVARTPLLQQLATGPLKLTGLPPSILAQPLSAQVAFLVGLLREDPTAVNLELSQGSRRIVTPDPDRRIVDRTTTVTEHFNTTGTPAGHGFTAANISQGTAYYTFDIGQMRGIVLDTVVSAGGADGSLDPDQLAWLEAQLQAASSRWLSPGGDVVTRQGRHDKLAVIFSHHTIGTMGNVPAGSGRIGGDEVAALLLRYPNAILWVNGHTHRNQVLAHARAAGSAISGGFWELNTAAHIDWPEQSRIVEIVDNLDRTLSVFGTILDHAGPIARGGLSTTKELAALSREIAANDWQDRTDFRRGSISDRNVELVVPAPFASSGQAQAVSAARMAGSGARLSAVQRR